MSFVPYIKQVSRCSFPSPGQHYENQKHPVLREWRKKNAFITYRLVYCNSLLSGHPNKFLKGLLLLLWLIQNAAARVLTKTPPPPSPLHVHHTLTCYEPCSLVDFVSPLSSSFSPCPHPTGVESSLLHVPATPAAAIFLCTANIRHYHTFLLAFVLSILSSCDNFSWTEIFIDAFFSVCFLIFVNIGKADTL